MSDNNSNLLWKNIKLANMYRTDPSIAPPTVHTHTSRAGIALLACTAGGTTLESIRYFQLTFLVLAFLSRFVNVR